MLNNNKGFTMIEIMAVFIILGIVMAITIPTISYFLKGNSKDYYSKLEKTVSSSAQDYFNDYRVNLPKEIGYVKRVDINIIQSQKYITEILGIDKKACSGDVVTQKRANGNYSYTACLKCERKKDGSYAYVSDNTECGYSEDNNGKFTILIDGLGNKDNVRIPQGESYTIPNAKAYVNGQALTTIKPMPLSIDTNILTTYKIYYNYRSVIKELKITVYDPKEPVLNNITALVNNTNYTSGTFVNKDVDLKLSATDWTKANIYGSGIDYFEYQVNDGQIQKLKPTTTDNKTYTYDIKLKDSGTYNINVRAVDKEKNKSTKKTFVVKIDKIKPTGTITVSGNGGYNGLSIKANLLANDNNGGSGVKQMCLQESSDISRCSFENYVSSKNITLSGPLDGRNRTVHVWYKDGAGNISEATTSQEYKTYTECSQVNYAANFSSCNKVCGGGTQQKIATDKFTGNTCSSRTISQQCNTQSCCSSTTVTGYGTCSKTCGGGVKQVFRVSNYNGQSCSTAAETIPCNTHPCGPVSSTLATDASGNKLMIWNYDYVFPNVNHAGYGDASSRGVKLIFVDEYAGAQIYSGDNTRLALYSSCNRSYKNVSSSCGGTYAMDTHNITDKNITIQTGQLDTWQKLTYPDRASMGRGIESSHKYIQCLYNSAGTTAEVQKAHVADKIDFDYMFSIENCTKVSSRNTRCDMRVRLKMTFYNPVVNITSTESKLENMDDSCSQLAPYRTLDQLLPTTMHILGYVFYSDDGESYKSLSHVQSTDIRPFFVESQNAFR